MSILTRHYEVRIGTVTFGTRHNDSFAARASARRYFEIHDETRTAEILMIANGKATVVDTVEPYKR